MVWMILVNMENFKLMAFLLLEIWCHSPDPENKATVNKLIWNLVLTMVWMILVNMENFKLMAFLLLEIWCHKNFLSKMERVITIRYLPLGFKKNSTKITFYAWKHLSWNKFILPSAFLWFSSETRIFICLIFQDVSFQKQLQQPPWWIDFTKILPKCV